MPSCPKCGEHHDRHGYCRDCHAAYQREWRKTHSLSPAAKKRDIARSYAGVYKRRGRIALLSCEACGCDDAQMHHIDHERPLDVTWLCRPCHLDWHAFWRNVSRLTFEGWLADRRENSAQTPCLVPEHARADEVVG